MLPYPVIRRLQPACPSFEGSSFHYLVTSLLPCLSFCLSPVFSSSCALFCTSQTRNSFPFNHFRTLWPKHPGWGSSSFAEHGSPVMVHSPMLSPAFATHPRNPRLTSFLATLPKSSSRKFNYCHTYVPPHAPLPACPPWRATDPSPPEGQALTVLFSDHWSRITLFRQFGGCFPRPLSAN